MAKTENGPTLSPGGKRIGRPRMADETGTLALRAPVELVEAIDRYAADLARRLHGVTVTRNDAMRRLLTMGLKQAGFLHDPDGVNFADLKVDE